jgi:hypothetical protein
MPYQVGVAVAGGMNMWCTVVECLLQSDARNVMVAVDLENCFNAIDRDALVDELQRHPGLRALARYVVAAYPSGMVSTTHIAGEWRRLCTERGLAQGRPLSPVLASVLLQPCIIEAERAMAEAQGCSLQDFRAMAGIAAYLDDMTIVSSRPSHATHNARALRHFQVVAVAVLAIATGGWVMVVALLLLLVVVLSERSRPRPRMGL